MVFTLTVELWITNTRVKSLLKHVPATKMFLSIHQLARKQEQMACSKVNEEEPNTLKVALKQLKSEFVTLKESNGSVLDGEYLTTTVKESNGSVLDGEYVTTTEKESNGSVLDGEYVTTTVKESNGSALDGEYVTTTEKESNGSVLDGEYVTTTVKESNGSALDGEYVTTTEKESNGSVLEERICDHDSEIIEWQYSRWGNM
ncbi:uncharacterized protein LOC143251205 [Tachypleus tridentatus]|uniref:uncharacterized protein LOC143251205 n=1 Tax=Tachypleus tridentatus TaxID=6853 RepID=UPI003FD4C939